MNTTKDNEKIVKALNEAFSKAYCDYYENGDVGDYDKMLAFGDSLINSGKKKIKNLLSDFILYRQDFIASDREAAALGKAYKKVFDEDGEPRLETSEDVKIYKIHMDEEMVQLVLTALMEKAHQKGISKKAKENYLMAYGDIKECIC